MLLATQQRNYLPTAVMKPWARKADGNPLADGEAILRSARADTFLMVYRAAQLAMLNKWTAEAAGLAAVGRSNIVPIAMLERWTAEMTALQIEWTAVMVDAGMLLAREELGFQDPFRFGAQARSGAEFRGKQDDPDSPLILFDAGRRRGIQDPTSLLVQKDFTRIQEYSKQISTSIANTSRTKLVSVFNQASRDGLSAQKIAAELLKQGATSNKVRAEMLARTGTIWSYNEGALQNYTQLGVQVLEWQVTFDDKLCPFCASMQGAKVRTGSAFWNAGETMEVEIGEGADAIQRSLPFKFVVEHPPLHPNCRCVLLPVLTSVAVPVKPIADPKVIPSTTPQQAATAAEQKANRAASAIREAMLQQHQTSKAELDAITAELIIIDEEIAAAWKRTDIPSRDLVPQVHALSERRSALNRTADQLRFDAIEDVSKQIKSDNPVQFKRIGKQSKKSSIRKKQQEVDGVMNRLSALVDQSVVPDLTSISVQVNVTARRTRARAFIIDELDTIGIDIGTSTTRRTQMHELGHILEYRSDEIATAVQKFYTKRTEGEALVRLKDITDLNYKSNEMTRVDQWFNPYIGKVTGGGTKGHSEVLSMGIEALLTDPVKFATADPEHFDFIVDMLRGNFAPWQ